LAWQGMSGSVIKETYEDLLGAQTAIAETNFSEGEERLLQAQTRLKEVQDSMQEALSISGVIIQYLDVTGTVRSGDELLEAGQSLTLAGQHLARGAGCLGEGKNLTVCLEQMTSEFNAANQLLDEAEVSLEKVDGLFLSDEIKTKVESLKGIVIDLKQFLSVFLDNSDVLSALLGVDREKQYLLLFQNNHEMRPTGGFIGSVGLVDVDRGKIEEVDVQSVYDPDGQLNKFIIPPEPLRPIVDRWYLRDANWFVDYALRAKKVAQFFEKEGGPTVDGVIALDPEVIRELLALVGPVEVPEYQVTVDENNFWDVTQDQVSYSYDKELNRPKQFIADLAPEIISRVLNISGSDTWQVLGAVSEAVREKHLLVYFKDKDLQERAEEFGWDGRIPKDKQGLLAVNNANIGGHKSDQFVDQEIDYRLTLDKEGDVDVWLTIRRTHNGPSEGAHFDYPDKENPAVKDNVVWQRVLVPLEAELIEAKGFRAKSEVPSYIVHEDNDYMEPDTDVFEWESSQEVHDSGTTIGFESGYKFFANWQITSPGDTTIGMYHYRIPRRKALPNIIDPAQSFEAYVVKQPGDERSSVRVELVLPQGMKVVHTVPAGGITQEADNTVVYRGKLRTDLLVGAVYASGT